MTFAAWSNQKFWTVFSAISASCSYLALQQRIQVGAQGFNEWLNPWSQGFKA